MWTMYSTVFVYIPNKMAFIVAPYSVRMAHPTDCPRHGYIEASCAAGARDEELPKSAGDLLPVFIESAHRFKTDNAYIDISLDFFVARSGGGKDTQRINFRGRMENPKEITMYISGVFNKMLEPELPVDFVGYVLVSMEIMGSAEYTDWWRDRFQQLCAKRKPIPESVIGWRTRTSLTRS